MKTDYKIGDTVKAIKTDFNNLWNIGDIGTIVDIEEDDTYEVEFANNQKWSLDFKDIEPISIINDSTPKQYPTFNEFIGELVKAGSRHKERFCYDYFKQFCTVEVFPEVGKVYEFSNDKSFWTKKELEAISYDTYIGRFIHIRPIQPSRLDELKARLDELKARKSELSKYELLELIELMEITQ
jgi:hypothetical protein